MKTTTILPLGANVIVNTGGTDSHGILIKPKLNAHGYYWEEQKSYCVKFDNGTSQYIPVQYITNTEFLKEWQPYNELKKQVERAILNHFMKNTYQFQSTHEASSKKPFKPCTFGQIDTTLGLAYTSSGAYAGLWCCNSGYLWADDTHYFTGFAINTDGEVIAIAGDYEEHEIFIPLK